MSAELVLVEQLNIDQPYKRYTSEEKAGAYLYWRTAGGRSFNKTAQKLSIDRRTLSSWSQEDDWPSMAAADDQDDYASSRIGVAAIVVNELVPSIETAKSIRDDKSASARDRLAAAQWLAGLAGVSPVSKIEQAVVQAPTQRSEVIDIGDLSGMSPDELSKLEDSHRSKRKQITSEDRRRPPR